MGCAAAELDVHSSADSAARLLGTLSPLTVPTLSRTHSLETHCKPEHLPSAGEASEDILADGAGASSKAKTGACVPLVLPDSL